jgi:hypothetical protein
VHAIGAPPTDVHRPAVFFSRKKAALPKYTPLALTVPPGFASAAEFQARVGTALRGLEEEAASRFGKKGFKGVAWVLAQKPSSRPASREPRRALNPRVAARNAGQRVAALERNAEFVADYRAALTARRAGHADVVFPAGTYQLRIAHGVPCRPFGDATAVIPLASPQASSGRSCSPSPPTRS